MADPTKEQLETAKALTEELRRQREVAKDNLSTLNKTGPEYDAAVRALQGINTALDIEKAALAQIQKQRRDNNTEIKEEIALLQKTAASYEQLNASGRYKQELLDAQLAVEVKQLQLLRMSKDVSEEDLLKQQKKVDLLNEQIGAYKEQLQVAKELGATLGAVFAVYEKNNFFNVENAQKLAKAFAGGRMALEGMAKAMAGGLIKSYINSVISLVFKMEALEAEFIKTTGASREFASSIRSQYGDLRQYGVQLEEVSKSNTALYKTFTDFTTLAPDVRDEIANIGSLLARRGVDFADFASGIQTTNKAFGQTGIQAAHTAMELEALSSTLQIPPQLLATEFAKSSQALSKLGSDGPMAFKRLAYAFKQTGLEIAKIIKISEVFDTFDGAATGAGKLNAALGGNFVNAMDMMMATDPVERFSMIRDSLDAAGLEFNTMGYYQRKFIAESAGLEGPNELAMLMSGNFENMAGSINMSQAEIVDLEQRALEATNVQEKFNGVMRSFIVILEPLVNLLQTFGDYLTKNAGAAKILGYAIGGLVGLLLIQKTLMLAQRAILFILTPLKWAFGAAVSSETVQLGANNTVKSINNAVSLRTLALMKRSVPAMLAMGAATLMIGGAIYLAATGVSKLAESFRGLGDAAWPAAFAITGFMLAFVLMIAVLAKTAPLAAVAGTALLYLGGGIALIGAGMMMAASSLATFNKEIKNIEVDTMIKLLDSFKTFESTISIMDQIANSIMNIAKAINDIDDKKTIQLTTVLRTLSSAPVAANNATPTAASTSVIAAQSAAQAKATAEVAAAVGNVITQLEVNVGSNNKRTFGQKVNIPPIHTTVNVVLDKKVIGTAIDKSLGTKIAAATNNRAAGPGN